MNDLATSPNELLSWICALNLPSGSHSERGGRSHLSSTSRIHTRWSGDGSLYCVNNAMKTSRHFGDKWLKAGGYAWDRVPGGMSRKYGGLRGVMIRMRRGSRLVFLHGWQHDIRLETNTSSCSDAHFRKASLAGRLDE